MNDEHRNAPTDTPFRVVGAGLPITRRCMGCNGNSTTQGSRGAGTRWRCRACVAARESS